MEHLNEIAIVIKTSYVQFQREGERTNGGKMSSLSAVNSSEGEEAQRGRIMLQFLESSTAPNLSRRRAVVRCLILTLILLFLVISVCAITAWFLLSPRVPVIRINSLSVSNFSLLHPNLRAEMGFTVKNRSWKKLLWFSRIDVHLCYKNHEISKSYIKSFKLAKKKETNKSVKFSGRGFGGKEESTAKVETITKELCFNVSMNGSVFIPSGKSYSKKKFIAILCKDLMVERSTNGTWELNRVGKHDCSVRFV